MLKIPPSGPSPRGSEKVEVFESEKSKLVDFFRRRYPNADPPRVHRGLGQDYETAGFRFATQQAELMAEKGLSEAEAFDVVEKRYLEEVDARMLGAEVEASDV